MPREPGVAPRRNDRLSLWKHVSAVGGVLEVQFLDRTIGRLHGDRDVLQHQGAGREDHEDEREEADPHPPLRRPRAAGVARGGLEEADGPGARAGRVVTFAELDSAVGRFAGFLRSRGLAPGDRVAIFLENSPQFAIAYYGTLRAGGIAVCLNPMHKAVELVHEFEDSGARALVTTHPAWDVVEPIRARTKLETVVLTAYRDFLPENPALPPPPSFLESRDGERPAGTEALLDVLRTAPELKTQVPRALSDTALLQYTSGTTGTAKAAEITHGNLIANCELQRVYIGAG